MRGGILHGGILHDLDFFMKPVFMSMKCLADSKEWNVCHQMQVIDGRSDYGRFFTASS